MPGTRLLLCLILVSTSLAEKADVAEVCRNLAKGIDAEYLLEDINECNECEYTKFYDTAERISRDQPIGDTTVAGQSRLGSDEAWCTTGGGDYLEINAGAMTKLGGVSVQGYATLDSWIKTFQIEYEEEDGVFQKLQDENGNMEFQGNADATTVEDRKFNHPVVAKVIRITPQSSNAYPCMKVDLLSCDGESATEKSGAMFFSPGKNAKFNAGFWGDICTVDVLKDCDHCIFYKQDMFGCDTCDCDTDRESGKDAKFQSDILLTDLTKSAVNEKFGTHKYQGVMKGASRNMLRFNDYRSGNYYRVPYEISAGMSSRAPAAINSAIQELRKHTCIQLVPRTNEQYFIKFYRGGGCSSPVGKQPRGNTVSIGSGCEYMGTVVHEIMHSLGFWHEQSRPDRDQHVRIMTQNINQGMVYNFQKMGGSSINSLGSPYDTSSVMHYSSYAFSANRQPTIVDLRGNPIKTQRQGLSKEDIKQINRMYPCSGGTGTGTTTTTHTSPTVATTTSGSSCADQNGACRYWARIGECTKNPGYMLVRCKKSCNRCQGPGTPPTTCKDSDRRCRGWRRFCKSTLYSSYMTKNCPRTCNIC